MPDLFSEDSFRDDISIQNFDNNLEDVNDQFKDFYLRLKGYVESHAPLKKANFERNKAQTQTLDHGRY